MAAPVAIRKPPRKTWTVLDLYRKFGPIPLERIRQDPAPGCGTVQDVIRLKDLEKRLCELVDGILVEKTAGIEESYIGGTILTLLRNFVDPRALGMALPADGALQLDFNLVRIPDVSFISWERLTGDEFPDDPIPLLVPDLAVEVISRGNTRKEMDEKLKEYFEKGVRLVWYVRPRTRMVDVYTAPDRFTRLTASMRLEGGDVLPGFSVQVSELFTIPKRPGKPNGRRGR
jgi:Uma2 family endonuclease